MDDSVTGGDAVFTGSLFLRSDHGRILVIQEGANRGAYIIDTWVSSTEVTLKNAYHYYALRKRLNGSNYDVDFLLDGALVQSWVGVPNSSGGENAVWTLSAMKNYPPVGTATCTAQCMDDIRVSFIARPDSDILDDYSRGMLF